MKSLSWAIAATLLIGLSCTHAPVREKEWEALTAQIEQSLERTRKGKEIAPEPGLIDLAERASMLAESTFGPGDVRTAKSLHNLAQVYILSYRYEEAGPLFDKALSIYEDSSRKRSREHAKTLVDHGVFCILSSMQMPDNQKRAPASFKDAIGMLKELPQPTADLADTILYLAMFLGPTAPKEAETLYKRLIEVRAALLGKDHAEVAEAMTTLAGLYLSQDRLAEAEALYKRALAIHEKAATGDRSLLIGSLYDMGAVYEEQRKYDEAESYYRRAFEISERDYGPQSLDLAPDMAFMAGFYLYHGGYSGSVKAEALYRRLVSIYDKYPGKEDLAQAKAIYNLLLAMYVRGKKDDEGALLKKALSLWGRIPDRRDREYPEFADTLTYMALFFWNKKDSAKAETYFKRALVAWEHVPDREKSWGFPLFLDTVAAFYREKGMLSEAKKLEDRATAIKSKLNNERDLR
ncbi:MAG: tetratricopeptide repeat protein [Deltaproteobacteria bacterium]|nr:tetratricopeptide repeat protein [Deltaproteobacteria bacterium]